MAVLLFTLLLCIQILFAVFILFLCVSFITGGPFVPSNNESVTAMITAARLKKGMTVYDIGSGDGRVLFQAQTHGVNAIGIEINPFLVAWTNIRSMLLGKKRFVHAHWANLWNADLSKADVFFVYLIPWKMEALAAKLEKEAKDGALVVSNSFIFPKWNIEHSDVRHHIYTFRIKRNQS